MTARWDALPPATRLHRLQRDFEAAIEAYEDDGDAAQRGAAEAALTAMRSELYGSARGRALHLEYEQRLEQATDQRQE